MYNYYLVIKNKMPLPRCMETDTANKFKAQMIDLGEILVTQMN
jgi:hypothetical protein